MCMYCSLPMRGIERSNGHRTNAQPTVAAVPSLTRRSFSAGVLAAGLAASTRAFAADSQTVKIGTFGPFTGPAAGIGLEAKKGIEFAIQQFNAAGGIDGKKIELVAYDDRANRAEAVSVCRKMIES